MCYPIGKSGLRLHRRDLFSDTCAVRLHVSIEPCSSIMRLLCVFVSCADVLIISWADGLVRRHHVHQVNDPHYTRTLPRPLWNV